MWQLTDNLDVYVGAVRHVLDLHGQRVLPRVAPLRGADEEDGVHFAGASPYRLVLQGDAVFLPGHHRAGLALPRRVLLQKFSFHSEAFRHQEIPSLRVRPKMEKKK